MSNEKDRSVTHVASYIRYSTEEQRKNSFSAEMQRSECQEVIEEHYAGQNTVIEYFEDLGQSGAIGVQNPNRPGAEYREGLTAMLDGIAAGDIDVVVAYAQDRLAREEYLWHFMNTLFFQQFNVPVIFARESHDIMTDEGQMLSSIKAMHDSQERRKISKNVSAAAKQCAQEGYHRGKPPYGWQWDPEQEKKPRVRRRLVRDEVDGGVLLEIKNKYMNGWPTSHIVRDLHDRGIESPGGGLRWNTDGILKVLRNPVHAGLVRHKDDIYPGEHSDLLYWTPDERDRLLERIKERRGRLVRSNNTQKYLLTGLLYCGHCGRRLTGSPDHHAGRKYMCAKSSTHGKHELRTDGHEGDIRKCPGIYRSADDLEDAVVKAVRRLAESERVQSAAEQNLADAMEEKDERIRREFEATKQELEKKEEEFSELFRLRNEGTITEKEFETDNERRRKEEASLQGRHDELETKLQQRASRQAELKRAVELLEDFDQVWATMKAGERKELLRKLDPHMTIRRQDEDLVLTITPGFVEPVKIHFVSRPRRYSGKVGPDAPLTPVQLATLYLWREGLTRRQIGRKRNVSYGTVNWTISAIYRRLGCENMDEAVDMVEDRLDKYGDTLPLDGRAEKRPEDDPEVLTEKLTEVLKVAATGKGCVAIAEELGKHKSTVSRQLDQINDRLAVKNTEEAVQVAKERGLI